MHLRNKIYMKVGEKACAYFSLLAPAACSDQLLPKALVIDVSFAEATTTENYLVSVCQSCFIMLATGLLELNSSLIWVSLECPVA